MNTTSLFLPILVGFLSNFSGPLTLVTNLCLPPRHLLQFNQYLTHHHPVLIQHLNTLHQLNETQHHHVLVIVNLSCKDIKQQLIDETVAFHLNFYYRWFFVDMDDIHQTAEKTLETFADLPIMHSSEIYYCDLLQEHDTFEVDRIYRNSMTTDLIIEPIYLANQSAPDAITWTRKNPSLTASRLEAPALKQTTLRSTISVLDNSSWNHLDDYIDPHIDSLTKVSFQMTMQLIRYLNASIELHPADGFGYYDNATGQYTGMAGKFVRKEVDIACCTWFANTMRLPYLRFVSMTNPSKLRFLFQSPKLTMTENVFLLPFQTVVWFCILLMVILLIPILKLSSIAEWSRWKAAEDSIPLPRSDWTEVSTIIIGTTCQQGFETLYYSISARLVLLISLLVLLFIHTSFSANIVGLIQSPSTRIKTIQDLHDSVIKATFEDVDYNHFYFKQEDEPVRKSLYQNKIINKDGSITAYSTEDGVKMIRKGLFAFQCEIGRAFKYIADTYQEHEKCNLQILDYYINVKGLWYAVPRNSTYRRMITIAMFRLREHGIQTRENDLIYAKKPVCNGGAGGTFLSIGIADIRPAFLFLLWGFLTAALVLAAEVVYSKFGCRMAKREKMVVVEKIK